MEWVKSGKARCFVSTVGDTTVALAICVASACRNTSGYTGIYRGRDEQN